LGHSEQFLASNFAGAVHEIDEYAPARKANAEASNSSRRSLLLINASRRFIAGGRRSSFLFALIPIHPSQAVVVIHIVCLLCTLT
jgi:uncharacterized protein (DUF2062 family)